MTPGCAGSLTRGRPWRPCPGPRRRRAGILIAPQRVAADLGPGRLVITAGARAPNWFGYRSYDPLGTDPGAQVVVIHDWRTGLVQAVAIGNELGPRRTGAIGGSPSTCWHGPARHRSPCSAPGTQAWAPAMAIC